MEGFRRWDSMLPALPGGTCSPIIIIYLSVYVLFTNVPLKQAEILHLAGLAFLDRQGRSRWKLHGGAGGSWSSGHCSGPSGEGAASLT